MIVHEGICGFYRDRLLGRYIFLLDSPLLSPSLFAAVLFINRFQEIQHLHVKTANVIRRYPEQQKGTHELVPLLSHAFSRRRFQVFPNVQQLIMEMLNGR